MRGAMVVGATVRTAFQSYAADLTLGDGGAGRCHVTMPHDDAI